MVTTPSQYIYINTFYKYIKFGLVMRYCLYFLHVLWYDFRPIVWQIMYVLRIYE